MANALEPLASSKPPIIVGDYALQNAKQPHYLLSVTHRRGKRVPAPLCGLWSSSEDFRKAAETYHGTDRYGREALRARETEEAAEAKNRSEAREREYFEALRGRSTVDA